MATPLPSFPTTPAGFQDALASTPVVAKAMAGISAFLYLVGLVFPSAADVLALKATNTYGAHSYFWNLFTAGFFNTYFVVAVAATGSFIVVGRFLSSIWGPGEFLRYICFTNLCVGLSLFLWQIFKYMGSFNYHNLEDPVNGGMGMIAALLVTIKQRCPDEPIRVFGNQLGGFTGKDLPMLLILLCGVLSFIGLLPNLGQSISGAYFGWLYLRFLQKNADGMRGDAGDSMAFVCFFPAGLQPLVQVLSAFAHKIACGSSVQSMLDDLPMGSAGPTQMSANITTHAPAPAPRVPAPPLPGSNPADAERRRARALKALEERVRSITIDTPEAQQSLSEGVHQGEQSRAQMNGAGGGGENKKDDLESGPAA